MSSVTDFDIIKMMMPKIPNGKHTRIHLALGWAALVLFPIWLPLALSYIFFWILHLLGQGVHEFMLKGVGWLSDTMSEKDEEEERAKAKRKEARAAEDEEWKKKKAAEPKDEEETA